MKALLVSGVHESMLSQDGNRQARANGIDPDQTPQNAASDQDLQCL